MLQYSIGEKVDKKSWEGPARQPKPCSISIFANIGGALISVYQPSAETTDSVLVKGR
jgi:hypothetical protein